MQHLRYARGLMLTTAVLGLGVVSAQDASRASDSASTPAHLWSRLQTLARRNSPGPYPAAPPVSIRASAPRGTQALGAAPSDGDVVAALELRAPAPGPFVLHGTIPVPRGTFLEGSSISPFAVVDIDGFEVPAQTEIVSYYPVESDGADVVEVLARVQAPTGVAQGTPIRYEVVWRPHTVPTPHGPKTVGHLAEITENLSPQVRSFLENQNSLLIVAADPLGNLYFADPLRDQEVRFERFGQTSTQVRTYSTMWSPNSDYPGNTALPHLFGVHSYISTWEGEDFIGLDLRFNNGADGHSASNPLDDPLGKVYFRYVFLLVPSTWGVQQAVEDPFWGTPWNLGNFNIFPLIKANPDGKMHVMPSQAQFHRRLTLSPVTGIESGRAFLDKAGQAFNVGGVDPSTGQEYWSWFNPATARYFPQSRPLPNLDHYGATKLDDMLNEEHDRVRGYLADGKAETLGGQKPDGTYPCKHENLGWAHPFGVPGAGMVGGDEIYMFDGVRTAASASNLGYRTYEMVHRMQTDRMPIALYHANGRPGTVEDWVVEDPSGDYVPFIYFNGVMIGGIDVFGYDKAPQHQVQWVESNGLVADYAPTLLSYYAIDYQHYIRWTRSQKVLSWLGNDSLAKDDLLMAFEAFQMGYHEWPLFNGDAQEVGLLADIEEVTADPGRGFSFGRGEGWGLDTANAAFAVSDDPAWRAKTRNWMQDIAAVVLYGQSDQNGLIQSISNNKQFGGEYRFRQSIEAAIIENALLGMLEVAWRDVDPFYVTLLEDILVDSFYAMISPMSWWPGEYAPWAHVALGPVDGDASTQWSTHAEQTAPLPYNDCSKPECLTGHSDYHDSYQIGCSLAYAYELTGDPVFFNKALEFTQNPLGGQTLLNKLEADGMENIWNRSALLALAQLVLGP